MPDHAPSPFATPHSETAHLGWRLDTSYASLPDALWVAQAPVPVRAPAIVIYNRALAADLGLALSELPDDSLAALLSGNTLPPGAAPLAQAYAGHQFGHFTMLGDGRAVLLGEQITPDGRRVDVQLKGSGRTPFSRRGDGRAALGPMLREFIISEAMSALGVPTTRSLAVVTTGEAVFRDDVLPGAVLTRTAASHLRVGTFEFAATRTDRATLSALVHYTLARHFPERLPAELSGVDEARAARSLLEAVIDRQISLIAEWMRVGFVHGVMNTDNMALSGETIDYGPCAFLDAYDPATVFSSIDHGGRYAFGNQPALARWNLARFAETLLPLLDPVPQAGIDWATALFDTLPDRFDARWAGVLASKIGLPDTAETRALSTAFLAALQADGADYTNSFVSLTDVDTGSIPPFTTPALSRWYDDWRKVAATVPAEERRDRMNAANPRRIPRNHQVESALSAAVERGDLAPLHALLAALESPYADSPAFHAYSLPPEPSERVYQTFCGT